MSEWHNHRDEFPTDEEALYLVKITHNGFTMHYLAQIERDWSDRPTLVGYSTQGRRMPQIRQYNRAAPVDSLDLFAPPENERPQVFWKEVER